MKLSEVVIIKQCGCLMTMAQFHFFTRIVCFFLSLQFLQSFSEP